MATVLYISDEVVDLYGKKSLPIVQSVADINNLFGASTKGSYSIPFQVPATKSNKTLFVFPELLAEESWDGSIELPARLEVDGSVILDGVARITEVVVNEIGSEYKITLYDNNSSWINDRKGELLTDLDFSEYNHLWNSINVRNSEILTDDSFYVYPLVNYGLPEGGTTFWAVNDRLAHFRVWNIFLKIFEGAGYTIESEFINSDNFKRLFISPKGRPKITENELTDNRFFVYGNYGDATEDLGINQLGLTAIAIDFDTDEDVGGKVFFNTVTDDFNLAGNKYVSNIDARMSFAFNGTLSKINLGASSLLKSPESEVYIHLVKNGVVQQTRILVIPEVRASGPTRLDTSIDVDFNVIDVYQGEIVQVFVATNRDYNTAPTTLHTIIYPEFRNDVFENIGENMEVSISSMMPDHTQLDFIADIKEAFNLYFYTDEINKTVYVEPRDEFYNQEAIDWSDKVDKSSPVSISFMGQGSTKEVRYRYKEDDNDLYLKWREEELNNNKPWASYETSVTNVNAKDGTKEKSLKLFAPTYTGRGIIGAPSGIIPIMWNTEDQEMPENKFFDWDTRLLYYTGQRSLQNGETWNFAGVQSAKYPQMLMRNDNALNDWSLHWEDGAFTYGLYSKHWNNTIDTINDSRIFKMKLRLTAKDIANLDFRQPVYIEDSGDGNYYHIKKLSYDANNKKLVNAELVKVINPLPLAKLTEDRREIPVTPPDVVAPPSTVFITTVLDNIEYDVLGDEMKVQNGEVVKTGLTNKLPYNG